jgi:Mn2+/Fe2+ NRAMP family transporter
MNTVVSYLLISFSLSQDFMDYVLSGVIINIIIFFNVLVGTYEKRGSYEMVEKVGLYFVWVFVLQFLSSLIFKSFYYVTRTRICIIL